MTRNEAYAWTRGRQEIPGFILVSFLKHYRRSDVSQLGFALDRTESFTVLPATDRGTDEMVYLNRIYTKTGDSGETSLGNGCRVPKTDLRITAYGGVDELNAILGVTIALGLDRELAPSLVLIQNDLFDIGADLCVPESDVVSEHPPLRVTPSQVEQLEHWIDAANEHLQPLTSFILPGGSLAAAHLHHARTVCRRVEIGVLELADRDRINPHVVIYLNRLSDLLFVYARVANQNGRDDVLWVPGANRKT